MSATRSRTTSWRERCSTGTCARAETAALRADSLYRVVLDLRPAEGASIRSEDGPIPIDDAMAEAICCDAGVLTPDGKPDPRYSPPASDALRARIRARDGYKCLDLLVAASSSTSTTSCTGSTSDRMPGRIS